MAGEPVISINCERVGICESKNFGYRTVYHRIQVKLSRKYRVWPVPGDSRYQDLDPSEYMNRFTTITEKKT